MWKMTIIMRSIKHTQRIVVHILLICNAHLIELLRNVPLCCFIFPWRNRCYLLCFSDVKYTAEIFPAGTDSRYLRQVKYYCYKQSKFVYTIWQHNVINMKTDSLWHFCSLNLSETDSQKLFSWLLDHKKSMQTFYLRYIQHVFTHHWVDATPIPTDL